LKTSNSGPRPRRRPAAGNPGGVAFWLLAIIGVLGSFLVPMLIQLSIQPFLIGMAARSSSDFL
jgi:hypothetical protein